MLIKLSIKNQINWKKNKSTSKKIKKINSKPHSMELQVSYAQKQ